MNEQKSPKTLAISIGLLNLSGFGLGYLYIKRWARWGIHFFVTIVLLAAAILTNASKLPLVWISVISLWLLWMAFDGWRQGRNFTLEQGLLPINLLNNRLWLLIVIPLVVLGLEGAGLVGYYALGQKEFQQGVNAYQDADCSSALKHFNKVTTLYELSMSSNISTADARITECDMLVSADSTLKAGNYEEAIELYQEYLNAYPRGYLASHTLEALATSYFEWAAEFKADKNYVEAVNKYLIILKEYPDTSAVNQVASHISESYLSLSSQLWEAKDYQEAVDTARIPLAHYPATKFGKDAPDQIAQIYYDWAIYLQSQALYDDAVAKILIVLDEFPDTQAGETSPAFAAELYYAWAKELQGQDNYRDAANKILTVLAKFPDTQAGENASAFAAEIYYDWARYLIKNKDYQDSIAKYEIILDHYTAFLSSSEIEAEIKTAYLAWAEDLREKKSYQIAITKYQTLLKYYPQTIAEEEVDKLTLETHLAWGDALYQEGKFSDAIDKFAQAKELTTDPDLIQSAEEGYAKALWGLSQDEGPAGDKIVQDAFSTACDGDPAQSPAIGLAEDEPGKALACSSTPRLTLPQDLKADYPGHFQYVVSISEGIKTVETCPYEAGHSLIRQREYWTVIVRSTVTGGVYSSKTFYGSQPAKCESVEMFYGNIKYKYGTEPSMDEVIAWLKVVIR